MVIYGGEKELHRVPQTVHDSVELCVQAHLWYVQPPYLPFFSRRWRFRVLLRKWSPRSDSPCPRPWTARKIPLPVCRRPAIWRIGRTQTVGAVGLRQFPPLSAASGDPEHPVQHRPVILSGTASLSCFFRRQQLDPFPLFFC